MIGNKDKNNEKQGQVAGILLLKRSGTHES